MRTCYEWVMETVVADEYEDIWDVNFDDLNYFRDAQLRLAMTGERVDYVDTPSEEGVGDSAPSKVFYRLALVKRKVEDGDILMQDYAYMQADGTLALGDETDFEAPLYLRNALAKRIAKIK